MPYISPDRRPVTGWPKSSGDLNYLLTKSLNEFILRKGLSYVTLNDAIGALECAKLELYRRVIGPYEDTKIKANGDVYSPEILTP